MSEEKISPKVIRAIVGVGMLSFCGVVVETAMNITFPTLMTEFGINTSTVQWMTMIYLLVVASVVPLSAYLKRSFKTKSVSFSSQLVVYFGCSNRCYCAKFCHSFIWSCGPRDWCRNCPSFDV